MATTALNQDSHSLDFGVLYKTHCDAVKAIVRRFGFYDASADDIIQDIFINAWQKIDQLKVPEAFSGWLRTLARNMCVNEIRRSRREIQVSPTDFLDEDGCIIIEAPDPRLSMQIEVSLQHLRVIIEEHQDLIRRQVAMLFYLDERSVKEITKMLDMNPNTVVSHLRRFRFIATKALQQLVEEKSWDLMA